MHTKIENPRSEYKLTGTCLASKKLKLLTATSSDVYSQADRSKERTLFGETPLCRNLIRLVKPAVLRQPDILNNDPFSPCINLIMHAA